MFFRLDSEWFFDRVDFSEYDDILELSWEGLGTFYFSKSGEVTLSTYSSELDYSEVDVDDLGPFITPAFPWIRQNMVADDDYLIGQIHEFVATLMYLAPGDRDLIFETSAGGREELSFTLDGLTDKVKLDISGLGTVFVERDGRMYLHTYEEDDFTSDNVKIILIT